MSSSSLNKVSSFVLSDFQYKRVEIGDLQSPDISTYYFGPRTLTLIHSGKRKDIVLLLPEQHDILEMNVAMLSVDESSFKVL